MMTVKRSWMRGAVTASVFCAVSAPALAFFPPIINPVTITKNPTPVQPVKIPPVDPVIKPHPKPHPKPQDCCCGTTTGTTAHSPEPTTLLSAGIGAGIAGFVGWMKKRRKPID